MHVFCYDVHVIDKLCYVTSNEKEAIHKCQCMEKFFQNQTYKK